MAPDSNFKIHYRLKVCFLSRSIIDTQIILFQNYIISFFLESNLFFEVFSNTIVKAG